jgi:hypothetical protein
VSVTTSPQGAAVPLWIAIEKPIAAIERPSAGSGSSSVSLEIQKAEKLNKAKYKSLA